MTTDYNLDKDSPFELPDQLRAIADAYRVAEAELRSAWQDETPKGWAIAAGALDVAATRIENRFKRSGLPT